MPNFSKAFHQLLQSLSLSQSSIKETSDLVLQNLQQIDVACKLWHQQANGASEKELVCLLYLMDDILQRMEPSEASIKEELFNRLLGSLSLFSGPMATVFLVRIFTGWSNNHILSEESIKLLLDKGKITEEDMAKQEEFELSGLTELLCVYQEMANVLSVGSTCQIGKACSDLGAKLNSNKEGGSNDLKLLLPKLKSLRSKYANRVEDMRESMIACQIQTKNLRSYYDNYSLLLSSTCKILEDYSHYRNKIIQLRWKVEKVKEKLLEMCELENSKKLCMDSHDITDMDVVDEEEFPRSIGEQISKTKTQVQTIRHNSSSTSGGGYLESGFLPSSQMYFQVPASEHPTVVDYNHGLSGTPFVGFAPFYPHHHYSEYSHYPETEDMTQVFYDANPYMTAPFYPYNRFFH